MNHYFTNNINVFILSDQLTARDKYIMSCGLTLLLDCKTRWGTIVRMIERFLEAQGPIHHVLRDVKMAHLFPTPEEIAKITSVTKALGIVDSCSKELCARDATLSTADIIFESMIGELAQIDCPYAKRLTGADQVWYHSVKLL